MSNTLNVRKLYISKEILSNVVTKNIIVNLKFVTVYLILYEWLTVTQVQKIRKKEEE